ncbi:DUF975 family protein [Lactiplantibacillus plantarum]|uniref:DUF975 family protein n=1 Tax=Lactiplantibacillus plantarum TaxID=1590 RepID=UPI0007B55724|nr:DUF975 family protein [Lactiplantibacillus plantarum]KZU73144.1 Integral membrane protein [Lactiplantibacillus plantarum]
MQRSEIKHAAKLILNNHFGFFVLLFLPVFILELLSDLASFKSKNIEWTFWDSIGSVLSILLGLIMIGIMYVLIDLFRNSTDFQFPLQKSFTVFQNGTYFISSILISLLSFVWIFLWSWLLIVPGIIKYLAYSQAYYIYRDAIDSNQSLRCRDAISKSRALMNGHKWEYFVLQLSFIGWGLLVLVTCGIAALWVQPYYHLTMAKYYQQLTASVDNN